MNIGLERQVSVRGSGRLLSGAAATALVATVALTSVPTSASAFNIGGLIGTAIALQYGGGHFGGRSYSHHARSHEHVRHEREYAGKSRDHDSAGEEKDAREVDTVDSDKGSDNKASPRHQPSGPTTSTLQASESDARAGKVASDAPSFTPSR